MPSLRQECQEGTVRPRQLTIELVPEPPVYLDHHATTPCDPRVVEAMLPYFSEHFGNPASIIHAHGRKASQATEDARIAIARFFGVLPPEIYFTAGATESNNIALNILEPGDHLITSVIEHKSVIAPAQRLEKQGVEVTWLTPDREGFLDPIAVRDAIRPATRLVSIEAASGEIGTIQPIREIAAICREQRVAFHTDITQAAGKIELDLTGVTLASFSAHKVYGPKGIGGLFVRRGTRVEPVVTGGGQERNVRSGTVNVPAVIGMATAFQLRVEEMATEAEALTALRNQLWDAVVESIPGASVNGSRELRLPGNLNLSFARIDAEALILAMKRFSLSSGSACSTGERGPSRVLTAIGLSDAEAMSSLRIGLGKSNTAAHVAMFVEDLARNVRRIREISAA
jgi:cysteine desulfurase